MKKPASISSPKAPHAVTRGPQGEVLVKHPATVGPHMMAPRPDYVEVPFGSMSKKQAPGGISGGLAPYQSEQGAEMGEFK